MTDTDHVCFQPIQFAAASRSGFSDVSIMTMGEADGHGVMVDGKTIDEFMKLSLGKTFPAYLTHAGALDANGRPLDRLGKEIGMFSGFYRDGDKIRARNFQFLESFIQAEPKTHATLVEMAQKFADKLGISPVVAHLKAWVMGDGSEVRATDKGKPGNALGAFPSMRIGGIKSCDFVQQPATNMGLFEAKVDHAPSDEPSTTLMSDQTILLSKHTEALTAKDGEITTLSAQHKDAITLLETKHKDAVAALQKKADDSLAALVLLQEKEKSLTSALAAKAQEAEDAAKYDMRKAGAPALEVALQSRTHNLPAPAATDAARWEQYAALCTAQKDGNGNVLSHVETPQAKAFKEKFLDRK